MVVGWPIGGRLATTFFTNSAASFGTELPHFGSPHPPSCSESQSYPVLTSHQHCWCRLYDIRTGQAVRNLETKCPTTSVEISRDGQFITTADGKDVKIWDARKFSLVKAHTLQHAAESATLYPSIKRFVAAGNDMWVRLFDSETGEELGEWSRQ
jgi:WD40 repeat protein